MNLQFLKAILLREDRRLVRKSVENPKLTAPEVLSEVALGSISVRTVQRRLTEAGLHGRVAAKKPFISKKNITKRLEFARRHLNWTEEDWAKVLWTDESKFNLCHSDGIRYVRRPVNKRYDPRYTIGTVKFGGGGIMVWGGFSKHGLGPLHRIEGIMDAIKYRNILTEVMLPYSREHMPADWVFQQDNDPKHTAKIIKKWFEDNQLRVLDWPAQSPDLNPIENLWGEVERKLIGKKFKRPDDLWEAVQAAWYNVPQERVNKLIESMPRRCKAVIDAKGSATKY